MHPHRWALLIPLVVATWKFKVGNIEHNIRTYRGLLPHGFRQLDGAGGVIPFGHPYIRQACHKALFSDAKSLGVKYPAYFNPIPWRFIAAITYHIVYGWRDGYYKKAPLDTDQQLPLFRKYLQQLKAMNEQQANRLAELCKSIHDTGRLLHEKSAPKSPTPEPPMRWAPDINKHYISCF